MQRTVYPSPALIVLVACGIAISYASQRQAYYDPFWLLVCTLLFGAGCLVAFNIMRGLPKTPVRILMTAAIWQRAKLGLGVGVAALIVSFAWLLSGLDSMRGGSWPDIAFVMVPTIFFALSGLVLVYYWLGLWAFGEVIKDEPAADEPPQEPRD
ncbi:MAG TPA: hypothetical protein VKV32_12265 [Stellaceae bacterium]|nr:hypothetical protein [Stellaceae bacterium]